MAQKKESPENKSFNSLSSNKLLRILEYLSTQGEPQRLQDISAALEISQSTVLRYLNTLVNQSYVSQDKATQRYMLTWKLCRLGYQISSHISLRDITLPFLRELSQAFKCSCCVAVRQEDELVYLDVVDYPSHNMGFLQHIGKQAPIHTTGSGKILLSGMTDAQVSRLAARRGLEAYTAKTITSLPALLAALSEIRARGYALDDEECEEGVRCVSAPLYDYTDHLAAAISVYGSIDRLEEEIILKDIVPALKEAARKISLRMGYLED